MFPICIKVKDIYSGHPYCEDGIESIILNPINIYKVISIEEKVKEESQNFEGQRDNESPIKTGYKLI